MLVGLARQIVRMQRSGEVGAFEKAEMLETYTRAALFMLIAEAAALQVQSPSPEDQRSAEHLGAIISALSLLLLFAARVKRQIAAAGQHKKYQSSTHAFARAPFARRAQPTQPSWHLDSG